VGKHFKQKTRPSHADPWALILAKNSHELAHHLGKKKGSGQAPSNRHNTKIRDVQFMSVESGRCLLHAAKYHAIKNQKFSQAS